MRCSIGKRKEKKNRRKSENRKPTVIKLTKITTKTKEINRGR
jgi:hypothetical protein